MSRACLSRVIRVCAAALLTVAASTVAAQPLPSTVPIDTWGPSGQVTGVVRDGHLLYVAGDFVYVGPSTGQIARFSDATGTLLPGPVTDDIAGQFDDLIAVPGAGWIVSGVFSLPGDTRIRSMLRIEADGALNRAWRPDVDGVVDGVAIDGATLYIAGRFSAVNGQPRRSLAALDAVTGAVLPWAPQLEGRQIPTIPSVYHMQAHQGLVFLTGDIESVGGTPVGDLAAIDGVTGQLHPVAASPVADVTALAARGNELFVTGRLPGTAQTSGAVLTIDAGTWRSWPVPDLPFVRGLAVGPSAVYAHTTEVFVLDPVTGAQIGPPLLGNEYVNDIALGTDVLYVATSRSVHAVSLATRADVRPPILTDRLVPALASNGTELALAGNFDSAGGVRRDGLYALDLRTGRPTAFDPQVYSPAAMVRVGDVLVLGGFNLTRGASGPVLGSLAAVSLPDGAVLPWAPGVDRRVSALAADSRRVYIGGEFGTVGGVSRPYVAAFDLPSGRLSSFRPAPDGRVNALALDGDELVIGGLFTSVAGLPRKNVARVRTIDGSVTPWVAPPVRPPSGVAAAGGVTATAGATIVAGEPVPPNTLTLIDTAGRALPVTSPAAIADAIGVEMYGAQLVVAGTTSGGLVRAGLSRLDTGADAGWQATLIRRQAGPNWFVRRLPDMLLVGGTFTRVNGWPLRGLAVFPAEAALPPISLRGAVSGAQVSLAWTPGDAVPATSYQLDVSVAGTSLGPFVVAGTSIQARVAPATYEVRVRALVDGVPGLPSAPIRLVVPDPPIPPAAPSGLAATVSNGVVTLSWVAAADGANVTSFVVEAGSRSGVADLAVLRTGVLDTVFQAPAPSGTYHVRVRAANSHGLSAASNEVVVVVP